MRGRDVIILIVASVSFVGLSVVAAVISLFREGLGANTAAWVQAAGSIAAIAGAVWLFRSESMLRRRERRVAGEENAWAVRFAITNAQYEANKIADELTSEGRLSSPNSCDHWLYQTGNCKNVLKFLSERADHLHPALNHIASNGMLLLAQMEVDIGAILNFIAHQQRPPKEVIAQVCRYAELFDNLRELLDARMRGIVKALDENDDALPVTGDFWKVSRD